MKNKITFYIASCVPDGGVYRCELNEGGNVETTKVISSPSPMWIEPADYGNLWVLMRAPFEDSPNSGVAKYDLASGERIGEILSTEGEVACHLAVDGDDLYAANYISGSVWSSMGKLVTHSGNGINPVRQSSPHVHSVFFSPDKKYVLSCDLGIDKIFVYDRDLTLISEAITPAGAGARHLVFSKDGKHVYVISEMGAAIHVYKWLDGTLSHLSDVSILPEEMTEGKGSAIRLSADGKRLYVTERATKTIVTLSVDGEKLTLIDRIDCKGDEPRDLLLIDNENFAICANQFSDNCSMFKVRIDGTLEYLSSLKIEAPLCLLEAGR